MTTFSTLSTKLIGLSFGVVMAVVVNGAVLLQFDAMAKNADDAARVVQSMQAAKHIELPSVTIKASNAA